jgi:hypothetical protein
MHSYFSDRQSCSMKTLSIQRPLPSIDIFTPAPFRAQIRFVQPQLEDAAIAQECPLPIDFGWTTHCAWSALDPERRFLLSFFWRPLVVQQRT